MNIDIIISRGTYPTFHRRGMSPPLPVPAPRSPSLLSLDLADKVVAINQTRISSRANQNEICIRFLKDETKIRIREIRIYCADLALGSWAACIGKKSRKEHFLFSTEFASYVPGKVTSRISHCHSAA